jgi:hypothetical protein
MASTLRFDTWENTLGLTSASVSSLGYINYPAKPIISGQMGSISSIAATQKVPFDDFFVQRGITYNSSNRRFTVPQSGIYRISFNGFTITGYSAYRLFVGINTDTPNASTHKGHIYSNINAHQSFNLHSVVQLSAQDYIVFYLTEGGLYNLTGDRFNQFSIEMIG